MLDSKARVTSRSCRFSGARGEGKVFSFDLVDASGGEIRCTAFNDTADKFYEVIHQGEVYIISKASLKPKNAVGSDLCVSPPASVQLWPHCGRERPDYQEQLKQQQLDCQEQVEIWC